jgi:AcrR family transcriptional regulator
MKQDRRVKYTKAVLRDSLISLMKEKPVEKITVKEICEGADINRSTFYVHYASPQDLLDSIKEEMYDEVKASKGDLDDIQSLIRQLCDVFYSYRELLSIVIRSVDNIGFLFRVCEVWKPDMLRELNAMGIEGERAEVIYLFVASGAASVLVAWATGGFCRTADEMAAELVSLVLEGLGAYYKEGSHV